MLGTEVGDLVGDMEGAAAAGDREGVLDGERVGSRHWHATVGRIAWQTRGEPVLLHPVDVLL